MSSPPPAYGSAHIPTVVSRHPLWDEHDEESDPTGARVLDQGRLTLVTSWLDARPIALAKMPEDTIMPLLLALALSAVFTGVLLKSVSLTGVFAIVGLLLAGAWLWPEKEKQYT